MRRFDRDEHSGALVNRDDEGLAAYRVQKKILGRITALEHDLNKYSEEFNKRINYLQDRINAVGMIDTE